MDLRFWSLIKLLMQNILRNVFPTLFKFQMVYQGQANILAFIHTVAKVIKYTKL